MSDLTPQSILVAAVLLLGGTLIGFLVRKLISRAIPKQGPLRSERSRDVILDGVSKATLAWGTLAGLYAAVLTLPLERRLETAVVQILVAAAILAATVAGARLAGGLIEMYAHRQRIPGATSIFANIARVGIVAIGIMVMLQTSGVSVAPLLTALGVGGLAVALALQDTLSNLFAGLHVIGSKKVRPGDYVMLDTGEEGYVTDINWRNTALSTIQNSVVVVPNARLASAILTNYYQPGSETSLLIPVGVSYDSDLQRVEEITKEVGGEVMREVEGAVPQWEPLIRYNSFGEFSIGFSVVLRVNEPTKQYIVTHEFVKRLHRRYRREGIEIPFPIRTVVSRTLDGPPAEHHLIAAGGSD